MTGFNTILFPNVETSNWQMMPCERIALTGLLSRVRPKGAIEIGIYHGGSMSLTAPYVGKLIGIDIDPAVHERFTKPDNAEIWIGTSTELIPRAIETFRAANTPINYILIDADHSTEGVRRDIELVLDYVPTEPMFLLMHDSGNPETREGILSANWEKNPNLHSVDLDFVPGQIIEHAVSGGVGEVWGGLAVAYLDASARIGAPVIQQSARTTIRCLNHFARNLDALD